MLQSNRPEKPVIRLFRDYKHLARLYYSGATFVAFDTETTGLHADSNYLTEIGGVRFNYDGTIGDSFDSLIKPKELIPDTITNLTKITNDMVADKPGDEVVVPDFLNYINDKSTVLVAHNAPFDVGFINAALKRQNLPFLSNIVIDTLPLARWAYPMLSLESEKGQYKLQSLAKRFNINVISAHRADDDARVCMELFKRILQDTMSQQLDYSIPKEEIARTQQLELF